MRRSGVRDSARPVTERLTVTDVTVERREAGRIAGTILDRVSLVIEAGAVVAVTGPSGSGKTTLLHAIAGLIKPRSGTVTWGDTAISGVTESGRDRWRRNTVGLVFQDFQLLPELSVQANILLPLRFDHTMVPRASVDHATKLAMRVGLDPKRRRVSVLSRGEQQRVAIARALMRQPRLILADEPTASLDAETGARVADLLLEAASETGASVLLVSHDRALIERASLAYRLEAGVLRPSERA